MGNFSVRRPPQCHSETLRIAKVDLIRRGDFHIIVYSIQTNCTVLKPEAVYHPFTTMNDRFLAKPCTIESTAI